MKNIICLWIIATPSNLVSFFVTRVPEISLTPRGISQLAVSGRSDSDSVTKRSEEPGGAQGRREDCGELPKRACNDGDSSADKADDKANDVNQWRNQRKTRDKVTASRYRKSKPGAGVPFSPSVRRDRPPKAKGHRPSRLAPSPRPEVEPGRSCFTDRLTFASHSRRIQQVKALLTSDRLGVLCATGSTPGPLSALSEPRALLDLSSSLSPSCVFFSTKNGHGARTRTT